MTDIQTSTGAGQLSFFARVKAELKRLFVHAPSWEASAAATLTYLAPMVETVVTLTDPAVAPMVSAIIQRVQSAMAAAAVVMKDAGPTPTLVTYLNAVNSDLAQVMSAAQVKDSATRAKITALVSTVTGEVNAILQEATAATT
jgi:hypothetical protein